MTDLEVIFRERMDKSVGKQGSSLSGGQRQMVWLVRAILKKSPFIILDEPTASLDPESKQLVKKMISLMGEGKTLLLITHDEDLKEGMSRVLTFSKGKIISDTTNNSSKSSKSSSSSSSTANSTANKKMNITNSVNGVNGANNSNPQSFFNMNMWF
jgi:ABC-type transport system involved in cytochrome bd biosynthesis fused ATPase/permease subunit